MKAKLTFFVTMMVSFTLCVVIISMVAVLMTGLFDPLVDIVVLDGIYKRIRFRI